MSRVYCSARHISECQTPRRLLVDDVKATQLDTSTKIVTSAQLRELDVVDSFSVNFLSYLVFWSHENMVLSLSRSLVFVIEVAGI